MPHAISYAKHNQNKNWCLNKLNLNVTQHNITRLLMIQNTIHLQNLQQCKPKTQIESTQQCAQTQRA
jgi:hypothetical protein